LFPYMAIACQLAQHMTNKGRSVMAQHVTNKGRSVMAQHVANREV